MQCFFSHSFNVLHVEELHYIKVHCSLNYDEAMNISYDVSKEEKISI